MSKVSRYLSINQLCKLLGCQTPVERFDHPFDTGTYIGVFDYAIKEGKTEAEAEEMALEAESEEETEIWNTYIAAVEWVARNLFTKHHLSLTNIEKGKHRGSYLVSPDKSWKDSAEEIIQTINGYGMFGFSNIREFFRSGPYTPREAVLVHLHWISSWGEVYGEGKAKNMVEARLR